MSQILFPDPRQTDDDGLLVIGGDLSLENLKNAYEIGVFPWPQPGLPMLWFSPVNRGIIDFADFKVPSRLNRYLKKENFELRIDTSFRHVIENCAQSFRKNESGTWILPEMIDAYEEFHRAGYAHSIECWDEGEIVGGLYGVFIRGVFSAESMFFKKSHASKFCLIQLIEHLKKRNCSWVDIQMVTPITESFGGKYIVRNDFLERLKKSDPNIRFN